MNIDNKELLCPICKTGKEALELDPKSVFCPFIDLHNGKTCHKFTKVKEDDKH